MIVNYKKFFRNYIYTPNSSITSSRLNSSSVPFTFSFSYSATMFNSCTNSIFSNNAHLNKVGKSTPVNSALFLKRYSSSSLRCIDTIIPYIPNFRRIDLSTIYQLLLQLFFTHTILNLQLILILFANCLIIIFR